MFNLNVIKKVKKVNDKGFLTKGSEFTTKRLLIVKFDKIKAVGDQIQKEETYKHKTF